MRLTGCSLAAAMRAMRDRVNVFYFHFHARRQQQGSEVLGRLRQNMPGGEVDEIARITADSFVMMGFDPTVSTICASLLEWGEVRGSDAAERYCTTSFVSRRCVEDVEIGTTAFRAGDVCYVSLLPAADEVIPERPFPFGLGVHACAGKRYTAVLLEIAEDVRRTVFPDGLPDPVEVTPDGAFLAFKDA